MARYGWNGNFIDVVIKYASMSKWKGLSVRQAVFSNRLTESVVEMEGQNKMNKIIRPPGENFRDLVPQAFRHFHKQPWHNHQITMKTILSRRCVKVGSIIVVGGMLLCGCAQYTAINQPAPFKPKAAVVGAKRVNVAAELGSPISSEEETNHLLETYKYVDGGAKNNGASKTGRVILYTAGDLFTIFLDQVLTWPAETYGFAGTTHVVTVQYGKGDDGYWQVQDIQDVAQGESNNSASTNASSAKEEQSPTRR